MDLNTLSALVVEKIKDANGYSELDDKTLFKSIHGYLEMVYQNHFYLAQKKIKNEENCGLSLSKTRYKKEYDSVEDTVMIYANKLAATTKEQI